jgi:hypothetical protein
MNANRSGWLGPVQAALDRAAAPVVLFFRDDDAGWADERLLALLDRFAGHGLPVDVAVIPAALEPGLARELLDRRAGVHQHGYAHVNHEPAGRKCEFGTARARGAQRQDIAAGRERLSALLGDAVDPIFTPPWNRCTPDTGQCLAELGFRAVSRESRAAPLGVPGLRELPVAVDWFARRRGVRLTPDELGERLAAALSAAPAGVMFHHELMDAAELRRAGDLLRLVAEHPNARPEPMAALVA